MHIAKCLMKRSNLHEMFWGHAVNTACYIHNRLHCGSNPNGKTPYEMINNKRPNISNMRVFGCMAEVFVEKGLRDKSFDKGGDHSRSGIFLGYCNQSNGYIFHIPELKRIVTRRDAVFNESALPCVVGETSLANNSIEGDKPLPHLKTEVFVE